MTTRKIQFTQTFPGNPTDAQILEWLRYHLGIYGCIDGDNPLIDHEINVAFHSLKVRK